MTRASSDNFMVDFQFYRDQIVEPSAEQADEGEEANFDNSLAYKLLKQLLSLEFQAAGIQPEEASAFEELKEPQISHRFEEGPIPASFLPRAQLWYLGMEFMA